MKVEIVRTRYEVANPAVYSGYVFPIRPLRTDVLIDVDVTFTTSELPDELTFVDFNEYIFDEVHRQLREQMPTLDRIIPKSCAYVDMNGNMYATSYVFVVDFLANDLWVTECTGEDWPC